ncbi:Beta-barrel assembly machine subunit BamC [Formivibrio citricus]|uniref:Beta-barrel assembly machine subunit BamC n=1 Tax=Formivibrio citricus TaxID=83765 RepID=A0A1I4WC18_9NEIS|nr:outer membrane protein assembly factor BamC [Formivibrio citricus]SFN10790.1 Beta-barrel assembly machine subunit BamC [Formivibrio citricus]
MKAFRLVPIVLALVLAGCSSDDLLLQRRVDYRSGSDNLSKNPLEVPPDLSAPASKSTLSLPPRATLVAAASATASQVLPGSTKAKVVTAGGQRWLVVRGKPEKLWNEIREFWIANGFLITVDNPAVGIMETDWLENRAKLPQDALTRLLNKVSSRFASTGELDKYHVRIERGTELETTEIYVTHRGMIEAYRDDGSTQLRNTTAHVDTIWKPRPSDPVLEADMLALMLQHFGMDEQTARATVKTPAEQLTRAELSADGKSLSVFDSYDRAWRRVGLAIERSGFVINDRDRTKGVYYVRRADTDIAKEETTNYLGKLAFWRKNDADKKLAAEKLEYQLQIKQEVNRSVLTLKAKNTSDPALEKQLMDALLKQLK